MKKKHIIILGIVAGIVVSIIAFVSVNAKKSNYREYDIIIKNALSPTLGYENSKDSIVEYFDFTCPHCANFHLENLPKLYEEYIKTGKLKFISKIFLLRPQSIYPALASRCAYEQNKYWSYSKRLFEEFLKSGPFSYNRANYIRIASELNLDTIKFRECFDSQKYKDVILNETNEALKREVKATPTFFINNQKVEGNLPYDEFVKYIR
ncbi:MAG: DsbA family protein [candidate division WOR-3 bacterium]|nr:DsbA family protein [candidate division WOR-3 bacterium]MCX7948375.1 DsbA family protein [candidate division WOR-3 bacterium]MDW8151275.1 DsbA family protein [candidate division WOR-3 bacterium]